MISPNDILLITGGTGSFGNAVLNRFINDDRFKEIRIFSRVEKKQDDIRNKELYSGVIPSQSSVEDVN